MKIAELVDIHDRLDITDWRFWLALTGALLAVAWVGWLFSKLRMRDAQDEEARVGPDPWAVFNAAIADTRGQLHSLEARDLTYLVNAALRAFLESCLQLPVSEQTTEEFIHSLQSKRQLSPATAQALTDYLEQCDKIKYAGQALADDGKETMIQSAESLALAVKPAQQEVGS